MSEAEKLKSRIAELEAELDEYKRSEAKAIELMKEAYRKKGKLKAENKKLEKQIADANKVFAENPCGSGATAADWYKWLDRLRGALNQKSGEVEQK